MPKPVLAQKSEPKEERAILALLRSIKTGEISPRSVSVAERLNLVEHLRSDGFTIAEMAEILKVNEKTIRRDLDKIRAMHAVEYHPEFANQMVGMMVTTAEISIQQLRRKAREKDGTLLEIVMAHQATWKITKELIEKLQSLGRLPITATQVQGTIYHGVPDSTSDPAVIQAEIQRLEAIWNRNGLQPELGIKLAAIKKIVEESQSAKAVPLPPGAPSPAFQPSNSKGGDHVSQNDTVPL